MTDEPELTGTIQFGCLACRHHNVQDIGHKYQENIGFIFVCEKCQTKHAVSINVTIRDGTDIDTIVTEFIRLGNKPENRDAVEGKVMWIDR